MTQSGAFVTSVISNLIDPAYHRVPAAAARVGRGGRGRRLHRRGRSGEAGRLRGARRGEDGGRGGAHRVLPRRAGGLQTATRGAGPGRTAQDRHR